jgi:hypothetical protein
MGAARESSGRTGVPDESGVRCHHQQGVLTLTCDDVAFARLVAAVIATAGPTATGRGTVDVVVIRKPEPPSRPRPWLDLVGLMGCAAVAATVILLLGAGAYTLSRWVWQP